MGDDKCAGSDMQRSSEPKVCGHGQRNPRNCAECHPELFVARPSKERAVRIMKRAVSFLQIKEAAFPSHKGAAIIEEMQGFIVGNEAPQVETSEHRALAEIREICVTDYGPAAMARVSEIVRRVTPKASDGMCVHLMDPHTCSICSVQEIGKHG